MAYDTQPWKSDSLLYSLSTEDQFQVYSKKILKLKGHGQQSKAYQMLCSRKIVSVNEKESAAKLMTIVIEFKTQAKNDNPMNLCND